MKESITVDVIVSPNLKEFIISRYKGDVITLKRKSYLARLVKSNLVKTSPDWRPIKNENTIKIELFDFKGKNIRVYNHLNAQGQAIIEQYLRSIFETIFFNYVLGYGNARNWAIGSQKEAIEDFCLTYDLPMVKMNYDALIKAWNRSDQKKSILPFLPKKLRRTVH